jgi:hypothetical protein
LKDILHNQISISPISKIKKNQNKFKNISQFSNPIKPSKISKFISMTNTVNIYNKIFDILKFLKKYITDKLINIEHQYIYIFN